MSRAGVAPSAATPRARVIAAAEVLPGAVRVTAHGSAGVPEPVTGAAPTPIRPARWVSHWITGGDAPSSRERIQPCTASGVEMSSVSGKAGKVPSRPSSGTRWAATAAALPVAVPACSASSSRSRPAISCVVWALS